MQNSIIQNTKILIASDHAGFKLKDYLYKQLLSLNINIIDMGPVIYDENDDYTDTLKELLNYQNDTDENILSIIIGGSGTGEAIYANKHKNIRAVVANIEAESMYRIIELGKLHNNANCISLGARFISEDFALKCIEIFLLNDFSNEERHIRRINKLNN